MNEFTRGLRIQKTTYGIFLTLLADKFTFHKDM